MAAKRLTRAWTVEGMTCVNCEARIEKRLSALNGVESVRASYRTGRVEIAFDPGRVSPEDMCRTSTAAMSASDCNVR